MPLATGTTLGPYQILSLLGAGGMGEVYRARDGRLQRDVALKVLAPDLARDPDRLARFEREARAASALSHPAIVAIHDIGHVDGTSYIAMELVEGSPLRTQLAERPLLTRRLLAFAVPIAEGLARAHRAGIVHRDLKPENVMVSADGVVKIVDFGIAKLVPSADDLAATVTMPDGRTARGTVLGTAGYMSPEQASGRALDFRSDQFAFGIMLYEMATGRHPFLRATSPQTQSAIIEHEPGPVRSENPQLPLPLVWIIDRCLAKDPAERYGSTDDLARDLTRVRDHLSDPDLSPAPPGPTRRRLVPVLTAGVVLVAFVAGWLAPRRSEPDSAPVEPPTWRQLTFRQGSVQTARFASDGQTVVYSAAWDGRPIEMYTTTVSRPESRALDLPPAGLLAISRTGELALSLGCRSEGATGLCPGTLARAPLLGGAPREIAKDVLAADFGPGNELAIARRVNGAVQVEYPVDNRLSSTGIGHVKLSSDGRGVAWTQRTEDGGGLAVMVRREDGPRRVSSGWGFLTGLAWAPDGTAVFVSGQRTPDCDECVIRAGLDGTERPVLRSPGRLRLLDIAFDGRLLVARGVNRTRSYARLTAGGPTRDLSWFDGTVPDALSRDGRMLLFTERLVSSFGEDLYPVYVRTTEGGPAVRIGSGYGLDLSPDHRWALTRTRPTSGPASLVLLPLGAGESRTLESAGVDVGGGNQTAVFADARRIVFRGRLTTGPWRTYVQAIDGGNPALLEHEPGAIAAPVSPDGVRFVSQRADGTLWSATVSPGTAVPLPIRLDANQRIVQWTEDGRGLFVVTTDDTRIVITRVDLVSGRVTPVTEVLPQNQGTFGGLGRPLLTPDGRTLVFSESKGLSELYQVAGVK